MAPAFHPNVSARALAAQLFATTTRLEEARRELNVEGQLTIVLVTHSTFAADYAHRIVEMRDGRFVCEVGTSSGAGDAQALRLSA